MNRWLLLHLKVCNLKMLAPFRPQKEKRSCPYNMVKLKVNGQWCLINKLDEGMRINGNIDPRYKVCKVCKRSVTITICLFPYIGKSKELNHQIIRHNIKPISTVNTIYCNNGNGYFLPL